MPEHDYAAALAAWIEGEEYGTAADGLHLAPTDLTVVAMALRTIAAFAAAVSPSTEFKAAK